MVVMFAQIRELILGREAQFLRIMAVGEGHGGGDGLQESAGSEEVCTPASRDLQTARDLRGFPRTMPRSAGSAPGARASLVPGGSGARSRQHGCA